MRRRPWGTSSVPADFVADFSADFRVALCAGGTALALSAVASAQCRNPLVAWGKNNEGQCNVPAGLPPIKNNAAGMQRVLAIEAQSGLVRAWGRNSNGEGVVPKNLGPCVSVAAGNRHSVAVRADGELRC